MQSNLMRVTYEVIEVSTSWVTGLEVNKRVKAKSHLGVWSRPDLNLRVAYDTCMLYHADDAALLVLHMWHKSKQMLRYETVWQSHASQQEGTVPLTERYQIWQSLSNLK